MNPASVCSVVLAAATAWLSVGCEASAPAPAPASAAVAYPPSPPPPMASVPAARAPGTTQTAHASAFATPTADGAPNNGTAQPIDPTLAGAAGAILDKVAGNMAPGMSREGSPVAANFQTGQTMEQVVPLATGRCYTVLAAGPTVQAWDFSLILVANPLPVQPVLVHETATGSPAAMSGNGNCFKWPWPPVTARMVVRVTQGGGVAVAQLYGK